MSWNDRRRPKAKFSGVDTRDVAFFSRYAELTRIATIDTRAAEADWLLRRMPMEFSRTHDAEESFMMPLPSTPEEWRAQGFSFIGAPK